MKKLVLSLLTFALAFGSVHAQYDGQRGRRDKQQTGREYGQQHANKHRNKHAEKANGNYGGNAGAAGQMNRFYQELNLTSSQQQRAEQINSQMRSEIQSLRSNTSISQESKKREMMSIIQRNGAQFRSILDYQQAQKYDAMVSQMQQRRGGGRSVDNNNYTSANVSPNTQSLLSLLGSNATLSSLLGNNLSLGSLLGSNSSLLNILGGSISLDTILGLLSGLTQR